MRTRFTLVLLLAFSVLTIAMIWPLLSLDLNGLPDSDDAYFSAWRMAWVAHQLPRDPAHLFDGNNFYPTPATLAFSDAMLLVSLAGAPLLWGGAQVGLAHNILLAVALISSMWCAFLLVRDLTGSSHAAWIAAIILGFGAYRFAHIAHLELQWMMWMPLSLWALHRFFVEPTAARALGIGATLTAQTFCSIYYGVFLTGYVGIAWLLLLMTQKASRQRAVALSPLIVAPLIIVLFVYGPPYARTRAGQGPRDLAEVTAFSATPSDFFRVPPQNKLRGAAHNARPAPDERSLYPGTVALALAVAGLFAMPRRTRVVYGTLLAVSVDVSMGMNGILLPVVQKIIPIATSFRSPARLAHCCC